MTRTLPAALLFGMLSFAAAAQAPPMPPGISRTPIVDNASVMVARLTLAPAAREQVHTHPFDAVVVQISTGRVEMTIGDRTSTEVYQPGFVWFITRDTPHAAANVGEAPFDVVTVAIKAK